LLLIIPGSFGKLWSYQIWNETFSSDEEVKFEDNIGDFRSILLDGRRNYEKIFKDKPVAALDRYNGIL
jgi:ribosomal protein S18 acetylase RimI-like enzyme